MDWGKTECNYVQTKEEKRKKEKEEKVYNEWKKQVNW